jgi:cytochrome c peroxidase
MKKVLLYLNMTLLSSTMSLLVGCHNKDAVEPNIAIAAPASFPEVQYRVELNPVTNAGFELGRALFYEGKLSRDGSINCGSCHQQSAAFSHKGHIVSHGIHDRLGTRNAPPIMNLAWQKDFFWDGGVHDLDLQPIAPIQNPVEMDEKIANVLVKLKADAYYVSKFKDAFGTSEINTERMLKALSQFMVVLVSYNSRYDQYKRGTEVLSATELKGLDLFKQKCSSCHSTELFTDLSYRDNGLDETQRIDSGRFRITLNTKDKFKFKVPSLRNAEVTAPYMHDGRFRNLELVLEHYANNVHDNVNLDPLLKQNSSLGIAMTPEEQANIIAFIKTLTDKDFITDARFSEQAKK